MNKKLFLVTTIDDFHLIYYMLISIFGIVFFYQEFDENVLLAVLPFAIGFILYGVFVKYTTIIAGRIGIRNALLISILLFTTSVLGVLLYENNGNALYLYLWFVFYYLAKLFYHPSIIYLLGKSTNHSNRGKQFSYRQISIIIVATITPLIGGYVSEAQGLLGIIIIGVSFKMLSIIPTLLLPNQKFHVSLNIGEYLKIPNIRKLLALNLIKSFAESANRIWPIYLFLFWSSSFVNLGTLITISTGISMFSILILGKLLDSRDRYKILKLTTQLYGISFLFKALAKSNFAIVSSDLYGRFSSNLNSEASDTNNYDLMNDDIKPSNRDEVIVVREIGIDFSLGITLLIIGVIASFFSFQAAFIFAALSGLLVFFVKGNTQITK